MCVNGQVWIVVQDEDLGLLMLGEMTWRHMGCLFPMLERTPQQCLSRPSLSGQVVIMWWNARWKAEKKDVCLHQRWISLPKWTGRCWVTVPDPDHPSEGPC